MESQTIYKGFLSTDSEFRIFLCERATSARDNILHGQSEAFDWLNRVESLDLNYDLD